MGNERHSTNYPGVFYRIRRRLGGPSDEKVFYVVYKRNEKLIETQVGRQYRDDMTPARAASIRGQLIEGKRLTNAEERAAAQQKTWNITAIWEEYSDHLPKNRNTSDDNRFRKYIEPGLGTKKPAELAPLDIDRLRIKLLKTRSPQTVKHVIALIKRICNFGQNKGLCSGLSFTPQMPEVDNKVTEDLTPDELARLLSAIDADENKLVAAMMKLALVTGMRRGELFRLQWQHIDFNRCFIRIVTPKGGKEQSIPFNDAARELLKNMKRSSEYVFPGEGGAQRVTTPKASKRIMARAGLPKSFRPFHGLRHVFASMLASSGQVDLYVLQRLLTHKSPAMTQRYAHLRDDALRQGANIAAGIIAPGGQAKKGAA